MTGLTAAEVSESARAFPAAVSVAPDVLELRPDHRVLVMVAQGLEPGSPDEISDELLARAEIRARITLDGRAPEDVPQVAGLCHEVSLRATMSAWLTITPCG